MTVEGAHKHRQWLSICGGIILRPLAIPVRSGLGIDELSVSVPALPAVRRGSAAWTWAGAKPRPGGAAAGNGG